MSGPKWYTVVATGWGLDGGRIIDKETGERRPFFDIQCDGFSSGHLSEDSMIRKAWTAEEKQAKLDAAICFQGTLTKAGKPLKIKAKT